MSTAMVSCRDKMMGSTGVRRADASMTERSAPPLAEATVEGEQMSGLLKGRQHGLFASSVTLQEVTSWLTARNGWAAGTCNRSKNTDDDAGVRKFCGHAWRSEQGRWRGMLRGRCCVTGMREFGGHT